jgi:hypothetical protein
MRAKTREMARLNQGNMAQLSPLPNRNGWDKVCAHYKFDACTMSLSSESKSLADPKGYIKLLLTLIQPKIGWHIAIGVLAILLAPARMLKAVPPFSGTIFVEPDIFTDEDPTDYLGVSYSGQGNRTMYDRRTSSWVSKYAFLFDATFHGMPDVEVQVNPEFASRAAAETEAVKYAAVVGRLPRCLRTDLKTMWIHMGNQPYGGGNNNILIHTGKTSTYEAQGILEETIAHEASHTSLDSRHAATAGWLAAQNADDEFISTYARDNPTREDVAESFILYLAYRFRRDRITDELASTIIQTIPNRIAYFDGQDLGLQATEPAPWDNAVSLSEQWYLLPWLGVYFESSESWIYVPPLGWVYRPWGRTVDGWLYSDRLGWLWVDSEIFPSSYSIAEESWIYFNLPLAIYYHHGESIWLEL